MKCPYHHIVFKDNKTIQQCLLFGLDGITWVLDCKKCITDPEGRKRAWDHEEHHIKATMLGRIPKEFDGSFMACPHRGDKLEGVFKEEKCCGGKIKEIPMYECQRDNEPKTKKECLECLQKQRSEL